jgi:hypothetical protein
MKKLLILFVAVFAFSIEINFAGGVLMKSDLKNRFVEYWSYRAKKRFYKTYGFEMPYLRYLYSQDWYEDYFSTAPRIKKISIKKIDCKNDICKIGIILYFGKNYSYYTDKWVKVDNIWYHRFNDRPLPR